MKQLLIAAVAATAMSGAAQAATVTVVADPVYTTVSGSNVTLNFTGLDPTVSTEVDVSLAFTGDLNASTEFFTLSGEGEVAGTGCNDDITDGAVNDTDTCTQGGFSILNFTLDETDVANLFADGVLSLIFDLSRGVSAIIDLNGEEPIPGVVFPIVQNVAFAVGGKLSYETDDNGVEVIPLPAGMPLLLAGLGGLALLRRRH